MHEPLHVSMSLMLVAVYGSWLLASWERWVRTYFLMWMGGWSYLELTDIRVYLLLV